jgi:UDPglucose 6-dehydrogenase
MSGEYTDRFGKHAYTIAVLGVGHIGLPTMLAFAELGFDVVGADSNQEKVSKMQAGECPFYEPGMQELLTKHIGNPRFRLTTDIPSAIRQATVLFICVGTPQHEDGSADLTQVEGLVQVISRNLNGYKLIVEKSTVPAVTGQWIKRTMARHRSGLHAVAALQNGNGNGTGTAGRPDGSATERVFDVASNPEFLREGNAIHDFFHPDRIVCGVESKRAQQILTELYSSFTCPIVFTDLTTAELIKHTANAFLATKISFINMVSDVCDAVGADVSLVATGIGLDHRIGRSFLNAGIGYGGYCLPKDLAAFVKVGTDKGVNMGLLAEVQSVNDERVPRLLSKLNEAVWILRGKTIAIWGLSFKAGTDDVREAPALKVISVLLQRGAKVLAYDPKAIPNASRVLPAIPGTLTYADSAIDAVKGASAILILTEWPEFREPDFSLIREHMDIPVIVDGRNLLCSKTAQAAGFEYYCMGCAASPLPAEADQSVETTARVAIAEAS